MTVVKFENVGLRYSTGPEVLHDVTFSLEPGSFHFLTGASGAGKSSLLRLMYMGWRPTRGLVSLFGHDITMLERRQFPAIRRQIGVVFQEFRLLEHLTVFENVALPLRLQREKAADITRHVTELLEWVGIGERAHSMPRMLSGGQQQRVAIARAVIGRPPLILADEPTGNVDEEIGEKILYLFEELNKLGTTVVIATHNERNVRRLAYPRLHLNEGVLDMLPPAAGGITP